MSAHVPPDDFASWPQRRRDEWFAIANREISAGKKAERTNDTPYQFQTHGQSIGVAPPDKPHVTLTRASTLKPSPISWLWPGWLARGKMHVIGGQPGAGKTTLAMAMAAIVTKGGRWPDGSHSPLGSVVIWSGEDDPTDTLLPRLLASGADTERVFFVSDVRHGTETRAFDPAKDIDALRLAIEAAGGCAAIVIDPIVSAVATDSHKNADTRRALQPLVELAASINAALLGVTHLSKGTSGREPIERITGSIAFGALARVVMIAAKEAASEEGEAPRRFLARAKSNVGPDDGGFVYELRQEPMPGDDRIVASVAVFGEAIAGTARDMLDSAEAIEDGDAGAKESAARLLADLLADGPKSVRELKTAAEAHGVSWRTCERAKVDIGVKTVKPGFNTGWAWALDEDRQQVTKTATPKGWLPSQDLAAFGSPNDGREGVEI